MGKGPVSKQTRGLPPLVRALAFGCILLVLLLCTQEVLAPKGGCIDGFYAEPEDTIDVIFLGSSHANAAFAPAQMWRDSVPDAGSGPRCGRFPGRAGQRG